MNPVKPGQPIRAKDWNSLAGKVRPAANPVSGSGVLKTQNPGNTAFGLSRIPHEYALPAIVKEVVYADGANVPDPYVQNVSYRVAVIGSPSATHTAAPKYGRMFGSGVRIRPAAVGDLCYLVRIPRDEGGYTQDIEILSEQYLAAPCAPPGTTGGTGARIVRVDANGVIIVEPPPPPPGGGNLSPSSLPPPAAEP